MASGLLNSIIFFQELTKDALSYHKTRKKPNEQNIEDILDGRLYKAHFDDDGYFKGTDEYTKMMVKSFTSHFK